MAHYQTMAICNLLIPLALN